jgi:hypothetical protein
VTAQGHPRVIFKRAVERGNVVIAEATARELGLTLEEALQLVLLYGAFVFTADAGACGTWYQSSSGDIGDIVC